MNTFERGQFVEKDGLLAVVVGISGDKDVPDEHLALWFGDPFSKRISEGGSGGRSPEVWTVPAEYCTAASAPVIRH
jgi:hypothetical protein